MVTSVDNFHTGRRENLEEVRMLVGEPAWAAHRFIEGDIADPDVCRRACEGVDVVLHQAALASVTDSIRDPLASHRTNVTGFANLLLAACEANVGRVVYATSSAAYGDSQTLPTVEEKIGRMRSPYALTKYVNELYAEVFGRCYGIETIGLRYFNVFGPRQDPSSSYAAVIPRWVAEMLQGKRCVINGDGETSRDFCYVANAVQANLRAAVSANPEAVNQIYNVGAGGRTTLNQLHESIAAALGGLRTDLRIQTPEYADFRPDDIRHSLADLTKARRLLGYVPTHNVGTGLREAIGWYISRAVQPA